MFYIGLAAGALLMFILIVIYSSLAVAARADRNRMDDDWTYDQNKSERGNGFLENDVDFEPAFMEMDNSEFEPAFMEMNQSEFEPAFMEVERSEFEPAFMEIENSEFESGFMEIDNDKR